MPVSVRCLDDDKVYTIDEETGMIPGVSRTTPSTAPSNYGVAQAPELDEETKAMAASEIKRSHKARRGQRMKESVGLKSRTKDVGFIAAKLRQSVHLERIGKLVEAFEKRETTLKAVFEAEAELMARLDELAAQSPLEPTVNGLTSELHRQRRSVESLLAEHMDALRYACTRWKDTLLEADKDVSKDQEAARVQLDHYADKADGLRKAKEKRDMANLEKTAEAVKDGKQGPRANAKADDKYNRNEIKLKAAQDDFKATTATAVRVFDTGVMDRWNDLTPLVGQLLNFQTSLLEVADQAQPNIAAGHASLKALPTVVPLTARILNAKAGVPTVNEPPKLPAIEGTPVALPASDNTMVTPPPIPPAMIVEPIDLDDSITVPASAPPPPPDESEEEDDDDDDFDHPPSSVESLTLD